MPELACVFPLTIRIVGDLNDDGLDVLAGKIERAVGDRIIFAERELDRRAGVVGERILAPVAVSEEATIPERLLSTLGTYQLASYQGGGALVQVPVVAGRSEAPTRPDVTSTVARVHELLHPALFHAVSSREVHEAVTALEALPPLECLAAIRLLRSSGDWRVLGEHVSASDRLAFDALAQLADPSAGLIVPGDVIRLRFWSRGKEERELGGDFQVDSEGSVRLFLLHDPVALAGLAPTEAANAIAQAYVDGQLYLDVIVGLTPVRRGSLHAGATPTGPVEALSTATAARALLAWRERLVEFVAYIAVIRAEDDLTRSALARYHSQLGADLSRWRSPAELWKWALEQAGKPQPASPLQPYLDIQRAIAIEAAAAAGAERARIQRALSDFVAWLSEHATDPRLGTKAEGYNPGEIYNHFYLRALRADIAAGVVRAGRRRAEELEEKRWEAVGPTLEAATLLLRRTIGYVAPPRIAEDPKHLIGYLYQPSAAELIIRKKIGSDYIHDLLARAGTPRFPNAEDVAEDFDAWLRANPELRKALLLTSSHPDVEQYGIEIQAWQIAVEVIVGFIPIVGTIVGAKEVITGEDLFGHELSTTERVIIGVTLLLPAFGKLYKVGRGVLAAEEMVRLYGLSTREAAYTYRFALKLGPGTAGARLFASAGEEIRAGRKVTDQKLLQEMEQVLKDVGMTDKEAALALAEHPTSPLKATDPATEAAVEHALKKPSVAAPTEAVEKAAAAATKRTILQASTLPEYASKQSFMDAMRNRLLQRRQSGKPSILDFLIAPDGDWQKGTFTAKSGRQMRGRYALSAPDAQLVQAGHMEASAYAEAAGMPREYFMLEDADLNWLSGQAVETRGAYSSKPAVLIDGFAVDIPTAKLYEGHGLLPAGTVDAAPFIEPPPF